jgi:aspartyl-tRNA(Asn)/glutamyl-tRNA(Gln) amidotransferase subunit A
MSKLSDKTGSELKKIFENKEASAQEIASEYLRKAQNLNKELNAFISFNEDETIKYAKNLDDKKAKGENTGILSAVPIGIKDLINQVNTETTAASKMLKGYKSVFNATITQKVIDAGAIPLGKVNLDEFAMGSSNEKSAFGACKNPWDTKRVPGGSSGGSAAAVAAGLVPIAFGTDTGGSIRQPAAYCGIVGLKPTYGRVSRYGIVAFASSLDQAGPMAQTVEDTALLLQAMSGHDDKDSTSLKIPVPDYLGYIENNFKKKQDLKGVRIGIADDFFVDGLEADVNNSVQKAIEHYKSLGAEIVKIKFDKLKYGLPTYYIIAPSEASSNLSRYDGVRFGNRDQNAESLNDLYFQSRTEFGDEVKRRIMLGVYALSSGYYDAYYKKAQQVRRLIANDFNEAFQTCDLILTPTAPATAFEFGAKSGDPLSMYLEDIMTVTVNLAGLPGLSMNCGFDRNNMPIGMQLIAPALQEEQLLNAAYGFESTTDFNKRPDISRYCEATK